MTILNRVAVHQHNKLTLMLKEWWQTNLCQTQYVRNMQSHSSLSLFCHWQVSIRSRCVNLHPFAPHLLQVRAFWFLPDARTVMNRKLCKETTQKYWLTVKINCQNQIVFQNQLDIRGVRPEPTGLRFYRRNVSSLAWEVLQRAKPNMQPV